MIRTKRPVGLAAGSALLLALAGAMTACGGGGGASPAPGGATAPAPAPSSGRTATTLAGVAATGAPMSGASVVVRDGDASTPDVTTTTDADGRYTADVTALRPPLVVTASGTVLGETVTFKAVVPDVAAATATTANVTPLTHAVAALVAPGGDPANLASAAEIAARVRADAVRDAVTALVTTLAGDPGIRALLASGAGGDAARFDPMRTAFSANGDDVIDRVLEQVRIAVSSSGVSVANVAAATADGDGVPRSNAVVLTAANLAAPTRAPALPATAVTDRPGAAALRALADAFTACFALPPAARRTTRPDGSVATLAPACASLTTDDYRSNGYTFREEWAPLLGDAGMTGATFSPAAIAVSFPPLRHTHPRAIRHPYCDAAPCSVVQLGARQADGTPRGFFLAMARTPAGDPSGPWRVVGNHRKYDMSVESRTIRLMAVNEAGAATSPFWGRHRVETRIRYHFNPLGPNGADVRLVRIAPVAAPAGEGVVLVRSSQCNLSSRMVIANRSGTLVGGSPAAPLSWSGNTQSDLTYDAAMIDANGVPLADAPVWPNTALAPNANVAFALNPVQFDQELLPPWAVFRIEVFRFGSADPLVPDEIQYISMIHPTVRASAAATWSWAGVPQSFVDAYLRPGGAFAAPATPLATVPLSWAQPTGGPLYESAYFFGQAMVPTAGGGSANRRSLASGAATPVGAAGATMATGTFPANRIDSGVSTAPQTAAIGAAVNPACPSSPAPTDHSITPLLAGDTSAWREVGVQSRNWSGIHQTSAWFWRGATN